MNKALFALKLKTLTSDEVYEIYRLAYNERERRIAKANPGYRALHWRKSK